MFLQISFLLVYKLYFLPVALPTKPETPPESSPSPSPFPPFSPPRNLPVPLLLPLWFHVQIIHEINPGNPCKQGFCRNPLQNYTLFYTTAASFSIFPFPSPFFPARNAATPVFSRDWGKEGKKKVWQAALPHRMAPHG